MQIATRAEPYRLAAARVLPIFVFVVLPLILVALVLTKAAGEGLFALDFHNAFWPAGRLVLHGEFAYDSLVRDGDPFVYPPLTAVLFAPIAALPATAADILYTAVGIASVVFAVRSFGVRDWRCYGVAFLWPPVLAGIQAGNLTLLLLGGVGLLWRLRDRIVPLGLTGAILLSAKLFLWPLLLWFVVSRRYRAAMFALGFTVVLNAVAWVAIDAGNLSSYVHRLHALTLSEAWDTYTVKALIGRADLPALLGTAVTWSVVAVLAVVWWRARRDDRSSLAVAVIVAIVASPIVWLHYLALLIVPVALLRRTLGWIWFVPLVTIVCPGKGSGTAVQALVGVGVVAAVAAWTAVAAQRREIISTELASASSAA